MYKYTLFYTLPWASVFKPEGEASRTTLFRCFNKTEALIFNTFCTTMVNSGSIQMPGLCCLQGSMGTWQLLPLNILGWQTASQRLSGGFTSSRQVLRVFSKCFFYCKFAKKNRWLGREDMYLNFQVAFWAEVSLQVVGVSLCVLGEIWCWHLEGRAV